MAQDIYNDDDREQTVSTFHDLRQQRLLAKKKKRRRRIVGVLVLAAVCVGGYALRDHWMAPVAEFFEESRDTIINDGTPKSGGGFPIELSQSENNDLAAVEKMPVVISDTRITYFDEKGATVNSFQHLFANPVCCQMNKRLFVYDLNGNDFSVYDEKGEVYSKKTEDPILLASAGRSSHVAVVTQTDKYSSYLVIYDGSGKEVFKWASGQRILSVSFNEKENGCIVSTFSASGGQMVSRVYGLEFDKTEEVFETEDLNCLIYKASYCKNGDMWFVGDSILYRVGADGSVKYSYSYDMELANYSVDEECAVLAFDKITGDGSVIKIFGSDAEPAQISAESAVKCLSAQDGEGVYLTDDSFAVINGSGKIVASADIKKEYSDFVLMDDEVYFLGYDQVDKVDFEK